MTRPSGTDPLNRRRPAPIGDRALTLTLAATGGEVRRALHEIRATLSEWRVDDEAAAATEIVLAEVLNNIVEHAFADAPPGEILIWIEHRAEALAIAVVDDGTPMPGEAMPAAKRLELGVQIANLPEGGFGWGLIRALSAGLTYRRMSERNRLAFRILLAPERPAS